MPRRRDRLRHTAVHEAGHAVVGRVLRLDCGAVTIVANHAETEAGHAITADTMVTLARWDRIKRFRSDMMQGQAMKLLCLQAHHLRCKLFPVFPSAATTPPCRQSRCRPPARSRVRA